MNGPHRVAADRHDIGYGLRCCKASRVRFVDGSTPGSDGMARLQAGGTGWQNRLAHSMADVLRASMRVG